MKLVEHLPVTYSQLREATQKDPTLSKVLQFALNGWPVVMEDNQSLKPYFDRQYELSVEQGCLVWGLRVVIPQQLKKRMLEELHEGHLGIVKMKSVARNHLWWPGIDREIEEVTRSCEGCQQMK